MKINKVFDITLNIDNIHDIFTKDINNKLLTLIEKKYKHKCYQSSFILNINKIINRSLLEFNQNDLYCSCNISIQFEATCLIFNKNEVILNMKIHEIVNNNIILKNSDSSDLNEVIISLIKNNNDLIQLKKNDIIPITVGKVKYSLGSDKITINAYPFLPIVSHIEYFYISKLDDTQLELLKENILNYIIIEENIKNDILKTKQNTWTYFKTLIYPHLSTKVPDEKQSMVNLIELINNTEKYNNKIISLDDRYDLSNCNICIYDEHDTYTKGNLYLIFYDLCKKYYLYLKLINDLSIKYNSEKLINTNKHIFDLYNKYKK